MSKLTIIVSDNGDTRASAAAALYAKNPKNTRITTLLSDARAFLDEGHDVVMVSTSDEVAGLKEMASFHVGGTEHEIVQQDVDA
jgi:cellobiose-specific phosphotransferase system component IIA